MKMSLIENDNLRMDKLRAYYLGEDDGSKLSAADWRVLTRWQRCHSLYHRYRDRGKVIKWMQKEFTDISERTLHYDFTNAMDFFGSCIRFNKAFTLNQLIEDGMEAMQIAREERDMKAFATLLKTVGDMVSKFPEMKNPLDRQPKIIIIGNFREILPYEIEGDFDKELKKFIDMKFKKMSYDADAEIVEE